MKLIISESTNIELSGTQYLLEEGDIVLLEAPVKRKYLKVENGDEIKYYAPPSASDNYLLNFVERVCKKLKCNGNISIVRKLPSNERCRSIQYFMNELIPEDN